MPNSAELIAIVAEATGFATPTVATYFRILRVEQRVGTGGRGRNAMTLTLADATKVLLASLTSGEARESPETIDMLYALKQRRRAEFPRGRFHFPYAQVLRPTFFERLFHRDLPRPASFGLALDAMMAAIAAGRLTPTPEAEDWDTTIKPLGGNAAARRRPTPRFGEPYARLELRAVLAAGRFQVEGAELAYGRRETYGVALRFADPAISEISNAMLEMGATVADRRWVGLEVLRRLASAFADVESRSEI